MDSTQDSPNGQTAPRPPTDAPKPDSRPILVALHPDGYVEVYGENIAVHTMQLLDVAPSHEALAQEVAELELPWRFRRIYVPVNLHIVGQARRVTVYESVGIRTELELVRKCIPKEKKGKK